MMQIYYNGSIRTMDEAQPIVSAIAILHGRIAAVGDDDEILNAYGHLGKAHDLQGGFVIPGLTDAHLHLQKFALTLNVVDCETPTRAECLARVAERTSQVPPGKWILGHGWNQNTWPEGFGDHALLDAIAPDNPVYLTAKSLHAGWTNRLGMERAGITAQTPDPDGGHIQRGADGEPTGILMETAMRLLSQAIPTPTGAQNIQAIRVAQEVLLRMGVTGVHDFDQRESFVALQSLHRKGELKLRVVKSIPVELLAEAVKTGIGSGFGDDRLRIGMVKAFADGALGPHTAAMLSPYEDDPGNTGMVLLDNEQIFEFGQLAVQNGLGLTIHAIGDRANHEVINALENLRKYERANQLPAQRHRVEHVQLLHPDDIPRLAALDLIASMQPIHAISDMDAADAYWGERSRYGYAWKSLLNLDTRLAFGSDAPVDSPNPFWGLHAAVTRQRRDGSPGPDGWYPGERLTRLEALHAYTTGAAYAAGMEDRLGMLVPGYYADLLVLDRNYFNCPADEIHQIVPQRVMVNGEWVVG